MGEHVRTNTIVAYIRERISASPMRAISFRDYMDISLYHPEFGYYTADRIKVGKEGDFYTSAFIGGIIGEVLARFLVRLHRERGGKQPLAIVEWGGGDGTLARHMIGTIAREYPREYSGLKYCMIEHSPHHRAMQREALAEFAEHVAQIDGEQWFELEPAPGTIVLSNELLDAFPVHRLRLQEGIIREIFVAWQEKEGRFLEVLEPVSDPRLMEYVAKEKIEFKEGQTVEVNLAAEDWIRRVGSRLSEGTVVTIDYGDTRDQLFGAHRFHGTLMCYRNHVAHDDPYAAPGRQDMTAHVNFSACIRAGEEVGLSDWTLQTQQQFLIREGILELLQDHASPDPFSPAAKRNRAIRQLLLSDQMSELFKVLIQTKRS